jgi:hypothetical protein
MKERKMNINVMFKLDAASLDAKLKAEAESAGMLVKSIHVYLGRLAELSLVVLGKGKAMDGAIFLRRPDSGVAAMSSELQAEILEFAKSGKTQDMKAFVYEVEPPKPVSVEDEVLAFARRMSGAAPAAAPQALRPQVPPAPVQAPATPRPTANANGVRAVPTVPQRNAIPSTPRPGTTVSSVPPKPGHTRPSAPIQVNTSMFRPANKATSGDALDAAIEKAFGPGGPQELKPAARVVPAPLPPYKQLELPVTATQEFPDDEDVPVPDPNPIYVPELDDQDVDF